MITPSATRDNDNTTSLVEGHELLWLHVHHPQRLPRKQAAVNGLARLLGALDLQELHAHLSIPARAKHLQQGWDRTVGVKGLRW